MDGKGGNGTVAVNGGSDSYLAGGGAGNPGGNSEQIRGNYSFMPENGTGGLLIIYSNNIINNGKIYSYGSKGGYFLPPGYAIGGGGSSGGGSINIFYNNKFEQGTISSKNVLNDETGIGGAGGDGTVTIGNIATGTFENTELSTVENR